MQVQFRKTFINTSIALALVSSAGTASAFSFQAGDVDADIYGFVTLNAAMDFGQDIGSSTQAGSFGSLFPENGAEGHFDADAHQSRLGVKSTHKSGLKVIVEGDFRGGGGGSFRLLQAYGEYDNWLIGRAWSNYNSWTGWTPTLDFDSLAGGPGVQDRVAQVRYTVGNVSYALEDDYFPNIANTTNEKSALPVATVRYEGSMDGGLSLVAAGLLRQLSVDDGANVDETAFGIGAFAGASIDLGDGVSVQGNVNFSDGANSYLYRSGLDFGGPDAYLDGDDLETVSGYGVSLGASFPVGMGQINVSYGITMLDLDDMKDDLALSDAALNALSNETNSNAFVNYQWSPLESVSMGVEYGYFKAERENGDTSDTSRLIYSATFSF